MNTEEKRTCEVCGTQRAASREFCPVCLLRVGLEETTQVEASSPGGTIELISQEQLLRFDHYEVVKGQDGRPMELGRGAMGITYKAFDVNLRCPVALKVINEKYLGDEAARLRFVREARAAASVNQDRGDSPPAALV